MAGVHAQISSDLNEFRAANRGPTMALIESPGGGEELQSGVAPLREWPFCQVPAHDCEAAFESQTWQFDVTHEALVRCLQWHAWLVERVNVARCERCHSLQSLATPDIPLISR
jgi:hypothetical protein